MTYAGPTCYAAKTLFRVVGNPPASRGTRHLWRSVYNDVTAVRTPYLYAYSPCSLLLRIADVSNNFALFLFVSFCCRSCTKWADTCTTTPPVLLDLFLVDRPSSSVVVGEAKKQPWLPPTWTRWATYGTASPSRRPPGRHGLASLLHLFLFSLHCLLEFYSTTRVEYRCLLSSVLRSRCCCRSFTTVGFCRSV